MAMIVNSHRPLERFPVHVDLSEEFLKRNDNGSKETPENRAEKLQEMLRLINDCPELITRTDDIYLLRFLRAKYFHTNYAFQLLKNYEEFRTKYYDTWMNVDVPILKRLTCTGAVQVLPSRDQLERRVFWLRGGLWKPGDCSIECLLQAGALCGDATIVEPMTQVAGIVMIFDLKDVGITQIKGLTTAFAKKMVHYLANCLPVRINALHVIHEPSLFSMIFSIYKAFLTEKMKKRLYFHGSNLSSLHEHVSPACLPPELGGTFGEIDPNEWYKVLMGGIVLKVTSLCESGVRSWHQLLSVAESGACTIDAAFFFLPSPKHGSGHISELLHLDKGTPVSGRRRLCSPHQDAEPCYSADCV